MNERGIDTLIERNHISFNPDLKYTNDKPFEVNTPQTGIFTDDLAELEDYSFSNTQEMLEESKRQHDSLIAILKPKLDTIQVSEKDQNVDLIKKFTGSLSITPGDFEKAILSDTSEAFAVVQYYEGAHVGVEYGIEALCYRDVVIAKKDIETATESFNEMLIRLSKDALKNAAIDVANATIQEIDSQIKAEWETVKIDLMTAEEYYQRIKEEADFLGEGPIIDELGRAEKALSKAREVERNFSINPMVTYSKLFHDRADKATNICNTTYNLCKATMFDNFDEDLAWLIKKFSGNIEKITGYDKIKADPEQMQYIRSEIARNIAYLQTIQSILKGIAAAYAWKSIDLSNLIGKAINSAISFLVPLLFQKLSDLRVNTMKPCIDWLENNVPESYPPVFDRIGSVIIDAIEQLQQQFEETVMDFYRNTFSKYDNSQLKLQNIGNKKWMTDLYWVIQGVIDMLNGLSANLENIVEINLDKIALSVMVTNHWNYKYNPDTGLVEEITDLK